MSKPTTVEILASLKEMREACAACFRVIEYHALGLQAENELFYVCVKPGFGVRAQELIERIEEQVNAEQIQRG